MIDFLAKIVVPYANGKRKELKLSNNHPALAILMFLKVNAQKMSLRC